MTTSLPRRLRPTSDVPCNCGMFTFSRRELLPRYYQYCNESPLNTMNKPFTDDDESSRRTSTLPPVLHASYLSVETGIRFSRNGDQSPERPRVRREASQGRELVFQRRGSLSMHRPSSSQSIPAIRTPAGDGEWVLEVWAPNLSGSAKARVTSPCRPVRSWEVGSVMLTR